MKRLICRLRGHAPVRRTLSMDDRARVVSSRCRRCDRWFGDFTQPMLVRVDCSGIGLPDILCYATGEVGECGHDLAECWCRCGGSYCPRCQQRCADCQGFKDAIDRLTGAALAELDKAVLRGGPFWPTTSDEGSKA